MRKTLLLLLLTAVFCGAFARKTPQVAPAPQVPDSLRGFYLFTEGIKQAFIERDTAAARASLERSVEADSTYGPAWYELAELLLYNDAPAALRHAERAFRTDTTDKWYLLQLGQAQILNDRYRDAIRTYNRLREIDAQNPDSYRVLAMLYDQEGQPFSAIAVLDSAEVRFGRIDALSELKRRLLVGTRQYDRAVAEAQALIEAAPYKAENYLLLGELYARQKKDSLALVQFAEAYRIDSTSVAVLATYSEFYNERRDYASSLNYTRRLFASDEMPLDDQARLFRPDHRRPEFLQHLLPANQRPGYDAGDEISARSARGEALRRPPDRLGAARRRADLLQDASRRPPAPDRLLQHGDRHRELQAAARLGGALHFPRDEALPRKRRPPPAQGTDALLRQTVRRSAEILQELAPPGTG